MVSGWPVGEDKFSGRHEDLNPAPLDYRSSILTTAKPYHLYAMMVKSKSSCYGQFRIITHIYLEYLSASLSSMMLPWVHKKLHNKKDQTDKLMDLP